jgi:iron-sulfur cluster assembly protein
MIKLTPLAEEKVRDYLNKNGGCGIRIGVKTTGCSGLAYTIESIKLDTFDPLDVRIVYPYFVIKIQERHLVYLKDATMDWVINGLNEGFDFINPIEKDRCGCGESFRI